MEKHIYKENPEVFRAVTKQVLLNMRRPSRAVRYLKWTGNGFSSLEKHEHMHMVVSFSGERARTSESAGQRNIGGGSDYHPSMGMASVSMLMKEKNWEFFVWSMPRENFPVYPTKDDLRKMHENPAVHSFLQGQSGPREK